MTFDRSVAGLKLLRDRVDGEDLLGDGTRAAEIGDRGAVHLPARDLRVVLDELDAIGSVRSDTTVVDPRQTRGGVHVDADTWRDRWMLVRVGTDT